MKSILTLVIALLFTAAPFTASELYASPHDKDSHSWQKGDKDSRYSERERRYEKHEKHRMKQKKQKERPSGWDKGEKEGWNSNVPPGQEGKQQRDPRTRDWKRIENRRPWLE